MDRGAWWATVHRVAKSGTLSDLAHTMPAHVVYCRWIVHIDNGEQGILVCCIQWGRQESHTT